MSELFKKIYTGTLANYTKATKDSASLYMVYDEATGVKSMYKGEQKVAGDFIIVNGAAPTSPEKGIIYYISEFVKESGKDGKPFVGFWNGTQWVALSDSATIEGLESRISDLENATKINGTATAGSIGEKVAQLDGADTVDGSVKKQIKDAVEALDTEETGSSAGGLVTVTVKEVDGMIESVSVSDDIANTISAAIESLNATVGNTEVDTGKHVAVQVVEENGKLTGLTVTEDDIASAAKLEELDAAAVKSVNGIEPLEGSEGAITVGGADVLLTNYSEPGNTGKIESTDSVNVAIGKLERGLENAVAGGVTSVLKGDGISVDTTTPHTPKVSADVDNSAANGVQVVIDDTSKKIKASVTPGTVAQNDTSVVTGGAVYTAIETKIASLDKEDTAVTTQYVSSVSEADGIITVGRTNLVASGDKVLGTTDGNLTSTISLVYDSAKREIQLTGKGQAGELGVIDASIFIKDGMLWGEKAFVATATTETVSITKGSVTQTNEFSGLTVGHQYLAFCFTDGAVPTATYSWDIVDLQDLVDVYTAGDGLELDDHEFGIKLGESNNYLKFGTTTGDENAPLEANVVTLESASETVTGLADAYDVKATIVANEQVTSAALNDINTRIGDTTTLETTEKTLVPAINELKISIDDKNVDAEGETGNTALVTASASDNKVTVVSTSKLQSAVAAAETAIQSVSADDENQEVTVSTTDKAVTVGVTKATYANNALSEGGLVDATVLKNYVEDHTVYWEVLE